MNPIFQIFRLGTGVRLSMMRLASLFSWALLIMALLPATTRAQSAASPDSSVAAQSTPKNSSLDAPLFYQLLIGEMQWRLGEPGMAYGVILDAARRTKDEALFRRAVDIALQARAGDEALAATRAWRTVLPQSAEALRTQLQILVALNRLSDVQEPLTALLALAPTEADRAVLIQSLPRFFDRVGDAAAVARTSERVLQPYLQAPATHTLARVALGRLWSAAGQPERAITLAAEALKQSPKATAAIQLALELIPRDPKAESLVQDYFKGSQADPTLRLTYGRALAQSQRHAEAIAQLEQVTRDRPDMASAWLTLGALNLDLRQAHPAEQALLRYLQLTPDNPAPSGSSATSPNSTAVPTRVDRDDDEASPPENADSPIRSARTQAYLMLAQAAELRKDRAAAERYLSKVDNPAQAIQVQTRRASWLVQQGRTAEALALIRQLPERAAGDARLKLLAEGQIFREAKQWQAAYDAARSAAQRWPDDVELIYEQAMMAEKIQRLPEMEQLLRRVIEMQPDHQHAYNALGYSLADRGLRLHEARDLIRKALELAPADPFITDSLGWVEYRLGNLPEALQLLKQAYSARPDTEIAAHLGEVLWVSGQRDEARRVFREGRVRDAHNEVLQEVLARLKADL